MRAIAKLPPSIMAHRNDLGVESPETAENAVYIAVVHADDTVRFATSAPTRSELAKRLAEYVRRWGDHVLRPDHAHHLRGLLMRGEWEAAVEFYFGLVGERWDEEWLVTAVVPADDKRHVSAVVDEVAVPSDNRDSGDASSRSRLPRRDVKEA